jgi:hypothetical protein
MKFFYVGWILTLPLIVLYKYKTVSGVDKVEVAIVPECMHELYFSIIMSLCFYFVKISL